MFDRKIMPFARLARAATRRARGVLPSRPRPSILMYHRIADESFDPWGLAVTPAHFAEQLQWLAEHRTVLPLAEFASRQRNGTLPAEAVALTFDDGYECTAEIAAPMLEQARLPATIFVPAELIERERPFWWDELQELVLGHEGDRLTLDGQEVILGPRRADDEQWRPGAPPGTARQTAFHRLWAALRERRPAELDSAMADLRRQSSSHSRNRVRPMTPAQVRATAGGWISFGSHALTHPWLTSLSGAEKAREIFEGAARCEALAGSRPAAFAYPYGNFDSESEKLAEEAGFICACATLDEAVSANSRSYALPRVQVGDWTARGLAYALAHVRRQ